MTDKIMLSDCAVSPDVAFGYEGYEKIMIFFKMIPTVNTYYVQNNILLT